MDSTTLEKRADELTTLVADLFQVDAHYLHGNQIVLSLSHRFDPNKAIPLLKDRLTSAGYRYTLSTHEDSLLLSVNPERKLRVPTLNIVLFVVTLLSVYFIPVFWVNLNAPTLRLAVAATLDDLAAGRGLEFTAALISILFVHEMGHFLASRRRGIVTSWPYFIPAPNFIGTFGAVIRSKSPFWSRRDLIEVGAAGPIAGWIVALGWLVYGLSHSVVTPSDMLPYAGLAFSLDGESILVKTLVPVLIGPSPPGSLYLFSEAAFAGWVGLLITAMNMLPIGQFDGGHVIYGLAGRRQVLFGWIALGILVALGFQSATWWVFAAIGFAFGVGHPPTLDDRRPVSLAAMVTGLVSLVILLLSFTPVPFR
ncbi:MAG: site-2 protease family protein [Candidatus Zixiibacteriota bacterium]